MMRWLRRFLYSDDPVVKLAGALGEPEAEMWRELLANNGIVAMQKNVGSGAYYDLGRGMLSTRDYDLFVKQSDLGRAREILAPLLEGQEAEERSRNRRKHRRRP